MLTEFTTAVVFHILEWIGGRMPEFIARRFFSEERMLSRVSVSDKGSADAYVNEVRQVMINVSFQVHNHLPFPIKFEGIKGKTAVDNSTLMENFSFSSDEEIPANSDGKVTTAFDLSDYHANRLRGLGRDHIQLQVIGDARIFALGKALTKKIDVLLETGIHKTKPPLS